MWFKMINILVCAVIANVASDPDPKKYKADDGEKEKKPLPTLTADEKTFLREVEEKFGVKSEVPIKLENNTSEKIISKNTTQKGPFPAVIAIEIVNDTDSKSKGKRTIDANLGYGYRTNNGYTYTYFGKPTQEKGKFMIYPYSQPEGSAQNSHNSEYRQQHQVPEKHTQTTVEIQPSQAFELVSVQDERHYIEKPISSPSPQTYTSDAPETPSTLYTTYNGQELSGLSGHFPSLQSNYFVEPKQLLENPQYQEVGLNQEYLSSNSLDQNRPVVPVLVLRIPSSYLKNPTAELYANLPNNYPMSHYLNNVNLQGLVNQYFKKNGYNSAPQVMTYQTPHIVSSPITPTVSSTYSTEPQHNTYSSPHVQPTYTQSDYSGIHYSAVKPVMAKYPTGFSRPKHMHSHSPSYYRRPMPQQKYENRYQHASPQPTVNTQAYYEQSEYRSQQQPTAASYELQNEQAAVKPTIEAVSSDVGSQQYTSDHDTKIISVQYESNVPSHSSEVSETHNSERPQYDYSKESQEEYSPQQTLSHEYAGQSLSQYSSSELTSGYYTQKQPAHTEALSAYPSHATSAEQSHQTYSEVTATQGYDYPKPKEEQVSNTYVIPGSYPTKDHTVATVLPFSYAPIKRPNTATVQTVSYVTPMPHSKYQSRYRIMVPQTILKSQDSEKVTYVNSMPMHYTKTGYVYGQDHGAEEQYNQGTHYVTKPKHQSYPRNYHSYFKRMTRPENKAERSRHTSHANKQNEKTSS